MENTLAENRVSQTVLQMSWKNDRLRTPRNVTADVKKKLFASEIETAKNCLSDVQFIRGCQSPYFSSAMSIYTS